MTVAKVCGTDSSETYLRSSSTYSADGASLTGLTDALGNIATYTYNTSQGLLNTATDPLGTFP